MVADIGGTNARFGWQRAAGAQIEAVEVLPSAEFSSLEDALQRYLACCGRTRPAACAIAIATAVTDDRVAMTNHHWSFSIAALKSRFELDRLVVLNDFTALALALPALGAGELRQVGGERARPDGPKGLIGPGTGLGISGLLPNGRGGWVPIRGEGGHATLCAVTAREQAVVEELARMHGHASAERALSGRGLVDIHRALQRLARPHAPGGGHGHAAETSAQIMAKALQDGDEACAEALSLFCAFLGTTAGNLALTLGASGGVYVGGGIVPRLGTWFDRSDFRVRFEAQGRCRLHLAQMPVFVIDAAQPPALLGAARALELDFA